MQDKYIQSLRYKLQKRVRRVNSADPPHFITTIKHLIQFVQSMPILVAVRDELRARTSSMNITETVSRIIQGEMLSGDTEEEAAAIGYAMLERLADASADVPVVSMAMKWGAGSTYDEAFEFAREMFLEPFYEYVDEHIDDQQAMLYFLRHYKQRCEWFRGNQLRRCVEGETQTGERHLASDLYEYLHSQGIEFFIEPHSASGIADFVSEQIGDGRVVADTKIFWPEKSKGKHYLVAGFHQIYTYTRDFNEPCGYLVVYKMCKDDVHFLVPTINAMFPCVHVNNKTIFFVVIDLCEHGVSASKRGVLTSYDITYDELIHSVEAAEQSSSGP